MNYCFNCEKPTRNKFCSIICQKDYEYKKYIQEWKAGMYILKIFHLK